MCIAPAGNHRCGLTVLAAWGYCLGKQVREGPGSHGSACNNHMHVGEFGNKASPHKG
jgi:hypothetical protein